MAVKSVTSSRGIEDLLESAGGFGWFQVATTSCLLYNKFITGFSVMMMAFAGQTPTWLCEGPPGTDPNDWKQKACLVINNATAKEHPTECYSYYFTENEKTIVSEWSLVCGDADIKKAITSIQMGGLLAGALLAGQIGDVFGRRRTTYAFVLLHGILNILAGFAGSWQVFAVCRFFIGVGIGGILVTAFTLSLEFMPPKWRAICASLPVWAAGVSVLAVTAWRLHDWRDLHFICGGMGLFGVLGYWFVPESPRWLTVKDRLEEAEDVIAKIAHMNGRPTPEGISEVLKYVSEREKELRESQAQYTYLDILRDAHTAKITVIFCFQWFSFSLIFYGISFGISALAGNLYLNIFLMDALVIPFLGIVFFTSNSFGRKATALPLLVLACGASFACLALQKTNGPKDWITALSLTAKTGLAAAWAVLQTWGTEIYPTVTRNLGYGAANTAARIGGILAPYVIDFENAMVAAYITIGVFLAVDAAILLFLPETNGTALVDSLDAENGRKEYPLPTDVSRNIEQDNIVNVEQGQAEDNLHNSYSEGHGYYGSTVKLTPPPVYDNVEKLPGDLQGSAHTNPAFHGDDTGLSGTKL